MLQEYIELHEIYSNYFIFLTLDNYFSYHIFNKIKFIYT